MAGALRGTLSCIADGCTEDVWPDDWVVFESPVGEFEVFVCDTHYDLYAKCDFHPAGNSWSRAVELVMEHPVIHGEGN